MIEKHGLIIAKEGSAVGDNPHRMVFDSRDNIFHFLNRDDYISRYSEGFVKVPHNLGFPPYFSVWSHFNSVDAISGANIEKIFEDISGSLAPYCDKDNIYFTSQENAVNRPLGESYLMIGTYNLESPPDYTFAIP